MTEYIVRSRSRIFGPFYNAQDAIDWVEKVRPMLAINEHPLGVESLEDPTIRIPDEPERKRADDDDIAF